MKFGQGRTAADTRKLSFPENFKQIHVGVVDQFQTFIHYPEFNAFEVPVELERLQRLPPFECHVLVAAPVKVGRKQKCFFLTGLYIACKDCFRDSYDVPNISATIYVPQPEKALAGVSQSAIWKDAGIRSSQNSDGQPQWR